jgi:hypothetical protein
LEPGIGNSTFQVGEKAVRGFGGSFADHARRNRKRPLIVSRLLPSYS